MKKFQFQVGDRVTWANHPDKTKSTVIARGRYTARAVKFRFTPGDRFYLLDGSGPLRVVVEQFLKIDPTI